MSFSAFSTRAMCIRSPCSPRLFPAVVGGLLTLWLFRFHAFALLSHRPLPAHGHREKERHHDCRLRARIDSTKATIGARAIHEASVERFRPIIMTTLAALMGAVPLALGYRRGWILAAPARSRHRRRTDRLAVDHALYHAGDLSRAGMVPGERARSGAVPAQRAHPPRSRSRKARHRGITRAGAGRRALAA